ncbi:hypothetical protein JCM10212_005267 [Sporobolomyces blumeae]
MVLFSIPDIRLFWSEDDRFLSQFEDGKISTFKPYSKYPECYKDLAFWVPSPSSPSPSTLESSSSNERERGQEAGVGPQGGFAADGRVERDEGPRWHENDFMELVRDEAGDLVENVQLIDQFTHPKTGRESRCYRFNYRSMDRSLSNEEVNKIQERIIERVQAEMKVEVR